MDFETLNGWYSLQLFWEMDWKAYKKNDEATVKNQVAALHELTEEFKAEEDAGRGSYGYGRVIGDKADFSVMILHEDIQQLINWQDQLKRLDLFDEATLKVSYLSVNEATNYLIEKLTLESEHIQKKLKPKIGEEKYFCFYPMDKRNDWFSLPMEERQRMMASHGRIGASYKETLGHYVANSFGLDDHHWGVTLWGDDFDEFKNIVYEMRFDEASAVYGIFPYFILGEQIQPNDVEKYFLGEMK